jgi:hypothetical protein
MEVGSVRERALLRAGASESPSAASVREAARALGFLPRAALATFLLTAVARWVGRGVRALRSSSVLYGLVPAVVLGGTIVAWQWANARRAAELGVGSRPVAPPSAGYAMIPPEATSAAAPATVAESTTTTAAPVTVATAPTSDDAAGRPSRRPRRESADSVRQQLALIDRARASLESGDTAGALREVDRYGREYPSGMLSEEALLLRVRAVAARGDRVAASALARRFLAAYPRSVHAKAVRDLLTQVAD